MANQEHLARIRQGVEAWNRWRQEHPTIIPDLADAPLNGLNLSKADLEGTNLGGANLGGANLSRANLNNASLCRAYLSDADLCNSNLNNADLTLANLNDAKLRNADMKQARIGWTIFENIDLGVILNLDSVNHTGPSIIGLRTIHLSQGDVAELFLRRAGIPKQVEHVVAEIAARGNLYSCFISYSHADKSFARRLYDVLQSRGIRCWLDEKQLLPGDDIYDHVDRGIRLWDKVLLCCSEASLKSWWVDNEIGSAFEKEQQLTTERGGKVHVIIPLNLDGYIFSSSWKSGYRAEIRRRLAADFTGWDRDQGKFERAVEDVIKALRADEGAREPAPPSRL